MCKISNKNSVLEMKILIYWLDPFEFIDLNQILEFILYIYIVYLQDGLS